MSEHADELTRADELARGKENGVGQLDARVDEIRLKLKAKTGPLPSVTSVSVALELAAGNTDALRRLPPGGAARKNARRLCDRILAEGLLEGASLEPDIAVLDIAVLAPAPDNPARSTPLDSAFVNLRPTLHVDGSWIREHLPRLKHLEVSALELQNPALATRKLRACMESSELLQEVTVQYDVPAAGEAGADAARRADRHRRREEKALRNLDGSAAAEYRAAKAQERQLSRTIEAAVAATVDALVEKVCRWAVAWEPAAGPRHLGSGDWAWIPPAGLSGPELVRIEARFQNGIVDVTPFDFDASEFSCQQRRLTAAEGGRLLHLMDPSPRYVGERVRLRYLTQVPCHGHMGTRGTGRTYGFIWEPQPFGPMALQLLGTDLYAEAIYAGPIPGFYARSSQSELDAIWEYCGLDGYLNDLCDLARITSLDLMAKVSTKKGPWGNAGWTLGTADVVLFNPRTMAYDGLRLPGVPLANICGLGFAWPLAESRAGALAVLMKANEHPAVATSRLCDIDVAPHPIAVASCVAALDCPTTILHAIESRHAVAVKLLQLQECVQRQYLHQYVQVELGTPDSEGELFTGDQLLQKGRATLFDRRVSSTVIINDGRDKILRSSRHVLSFDESHILGGQCLASYSLIFGDGHPVTYTTRSVNRSGNLYLSTLCSDVDHVGTHACDCESGSECESDSESEPETESDTDSYGSL